MTYFIVLWSFCILQPPGNLKMQKTYHNLMFCTCVKICHKILKRIVNFITIARMLNYNILPERSFSGIAKLNLLVLSFWFDKQDKACFWCKFSELSASYITLKYWTLHSFLKKFCVPLRSLNFESSMCVDVLWYFATENRCINWRIAQ